MERLVDETLEQLRRFVKLPHLGLLQADVLLPMTVAALEFTAAFAEYVRLRGPRSAE